MVLWWLVTKIVAIVLILIGLFLIIFFPGVREHQDVAGGGSFGFSGIVLGFILLVIGIFVLFA